MVKRIICEDSNKDILIEIVRDTHLHFPDSYWMLSDIELTPIVHGDYSGIGKSEDRYLSYSVQELLNTGKKVFLKYEELLELLNDIRTVTYGLIFCFENDFIIDTKFHPMVKNETVTLPINDKSLCEIRIFEEIVIDMYSRIIG